MFEYVLKYLIIFVMALLFTNNNEKNELRLTNNMKTTQDENLYDLLVVGGGVNGAGIAMDAAGRGLRVNLCEMFDLGAATSSNSSKLIHGGLRYLEHYEFRLVKEALAERESLLRNAPHIMWPLRFILPHRPHLRPAWMIRIGLFLYDNLAKRETLKGSKGIKLDENSPLKKEIKRGFIYSDGWVDDARLVVFCALEAQRNGAEINTRTKVISAFRDSEYWTVDLQNQVTGEIRRVKTRALVNAAGPWVSSLFSEAMHCPAPKEIRMVKGSHIVVPRIHDSPEAYILQNEDGRIVFVIPYENKFSLIGTTDVDYVGNPKLAQISQEEIDYLLKIVNNHFIKQLTSLDIVWSYSGVRPLMDDERGDAQKASRDYTFEIDRKNNQAPLLSVFGGKITTYRKLAEAATDAICEFLPTSSGHWTKNASFPGGDFSNHESLQKALKSEFNWLDDEIISRYVRLYGTLTRSFLNGAKSQSDLGQNFGNGLYQREVDYLVECEWARELEDIIWRRTKLGLVMSSSQKNNLNEYLVQKVGQEH